MTFCVYGIRGSNDKRTYIGQCEYLLERLGRHNSGSVKSTASNRPWILIAVQFFETRAAARWVEYQLKKSRGKRNKWLRQNAVDQGSRWGYAPEGASREGKKDYLHFLYIAHGALSETQYFIHLAQRLHYLSLEDGDALREQMKSPLPVYTV
jgi:predicted GIY-YIG superfamily endonuclease